MARAGGIPLAPGAVLGERYRLERILGAGGMATVWLARDERLDRPVAVKALSDALAVDPSYVTRFEREARVAAGLSHPNLVKVFDFATDEARPYLVMEYIDGETLADRIAAGRKPDPERLAAELLGALANIHAAGITHRDVKPGNVLIGRDGRSRLTDFGIALPPDATRLTRTGQVVGTLKYMAPEVAEGGLADERSDLYAVGMVLQECVDGGGHPALAELVERLTARRPEQRPESASAAQAALETASSPRGAAVSARTEPTPTETLSLAPTDIAPAASREIHLDPARALVLLGAVALAALLLVAVLGGEGDDSSRPAERREPSEATAEKAAEEPTEGTEEPTEGTEEPTEGTEEPADGTEEPAADATEEPVPSEQAPEGAPAPQGKALGLEKSKGKSKGKGP